MPLLRSRRRPVRVFTARRTAAQGIRRGVIVSRRVSANTLIPGTGDARGPLSTRPRASYRDTGHALAGAMNMTLSGIVPDPPALRARPTSMALSYVAHAISISPQRSRGRNAVELAPPEPPCDPHRVFPDRRQSRGERVQAPSPGAAGAIEVKPSPHPPRSIKMKCGMEAETASCRPQI